MTSTDEHPTPEPQVDMDPDLPAGFDPDALDHEEADQ